MNTVYDFSAYEHSVMLGDHIRLDAYHAAIGAQVKEGMVVAEVGTGTGILSAYAAHATSAPVFAIEYKESFAKIAEKMVKTAGLKHVQILNGKSYDFLLEPSPDVLVTETIGAIGPEEHIVEICYDFKKRHPSVHTIIPSRLRMYAEPIRSKTITNSEQVFLDYFKAASYGTFNYEAIESELLQTRTAFLLFDNLKDAETVGDRVLLADYELGVASTPAFEKEIKLNAAECDGFHLYFEAVLDKNLILSTHYSQPETHWAHAYARKPASISASNPANESATNEEPHAAKVIVVSYVPSSARISVSWK